MDSVHFNALIHYLNFKDYLLNYLYLQLNIYTYPIFIAVILQPRIVHSSQE